MEPLWIFSTADNSIDLLGGVLYVAAIFYTALYLKLNNINIQGKIIYSFIGLISVLHIVQITSQLVFGGPVGYTFRLWDIINYLTGVLFLMVTHRLYKKEQKM